jgi:histidinol phosphatase-like enzyme
MSIRAIGLDIDGTVRYSFKDERKGQPIEDAKDVIAELKRRGIKLFVATNQAGATWREALSSRNKEGWEKYPTAEEVAEDIVSFAREVGLDDVYWCVSVYDPRIIKVLTPTVEESIAEATMPFGHAEEDYPEDILDEISREIGVGIQSTLRLAGMTANVSALPRWRKPESGMLKKAAENLKCSTDQILYVGDMDTDEQAAHNAGCSFFDVRKHRLEEIITIL